jgi:orotate phosphoribosyltransferase
MGNNQNSFTTKSWIIRKRNIGRQLLKSLYENRLFKTWLRDKPEGWELVSGYWSPFYIQMRNIASRPALFTLASKGLSELIQNEAVYGNRLIGIATTGIPLAAAVAIEMGMSMGYTRKLSGVRNAADLKLPRQDYGAHALVEGDLSNGDSLVLIDDVVARFTSKEVALQQIILEVEHRGLKDVKIDSIAVLIDREQGATEAAKAWGVPVISLLRLRSDGLAWLKGIALDRELEVIHNYLENQEQFQDPVLQEELRLEALSYIVGKNNLDKS